MPDPVYALLRAFLFRLDAERAHELSLWFAERAGGSPAALALLRWLYAPRFDPCLKTELAGLQFDCPIGLAAGLDKNGVAIRFWAALGFGFVEVGTVTPGAGQPGNDRPRLARDIEQRAIINRMGFNNSGADELALRLAKVTDGFLVGANIGKAKETPLAEASGDYVCALNSVWADSAYITINVSSPNTPGLRDLQAIDQLRGLIDAVQAENTRLATAHDGTRRPIFLKIAPDLADDELVAIAEMALETKLDALIATNTSIDTAILQKTPSISGGISGEPLKDRAQECTRILYRTLAQKIPIVGVGGIRSADDAYARIRAGASLLQVYSGLIFEGPAMIRRLCVGISHRLRADGFKTLKEAVGADSRP